MSDRLRGRQGGYRRALADPVRLDVAFYAGLYVEALEAEVERLLANLDVCSGDCELLRCEAGRLRGDLTEARARELGALKALLMERHGWTWPTVAYLGLDDARLIARTQTPPDPGRIRTEVEEEW